MSEVLFEVFDTQARFHTDGRMVPSPGRVVQVHADALLAVRAQVGPEAAWLLLEIALRAVLDPTSGKVVAETSAERLADELRTGTNKEHPGWSRKSVLNHLRALVEAGFVIREQTLAADAGRAGRKSWSTTRLVLSDRLTAVPDLAQRSVVGTTQDGSRSAVPIRDAATSSAVPDRAPAGKGAARSVVPVTDDAGAHPAGRGSSVVPSSVVPKTDSRASAGGRARHSAGPVTVGGARDDNIHVDDDLLQHQHVDRRPARRIAAAPGDGPALVDPSAVLSRRLTAPSLATVASPADESALARAAVLARARRLGFNGRDSVLQAESPARVLAWICSIEASPASTNPGGLLRTMLRDPTSWPPGFDSRCEVVVDQDGAAHLTLPSPAPGAVPAPAAPVSGPNGQTLLTTAAINAAMDALDDQCGGRHPARDEINERIRQLVEDGWRQPEAFKLAGTEVLAALDPHSAA